MSKYAEEKDEENNITTKREEYPETKFTAKHADYFKTYKPKDLDFSPKDRKTLYYSNSVKRRSTSTNYGPDECIGIKAYYEKIDGSFRSKYLLLQE